MIRSLLSSLFGPPPERDKDAGQPAPAAASPRAVLMVIDGVAIDAIGRADGACPNCGAILEKPPARKAACPHCGDFMHVRTRPLDGRRVLVSPTDIPRLEQQWATFSGFKETVRMIGYFDAEAQAIFEDLHTGRRGQTPIDWPRLYAIAATAGKPLRRS